MALLVDEDLRALRPLEYLVAEARLLFPRERVAETRAATALHAHTETALGDALLGHQRPDLLRGGFADLNHLHLVRLKPDATVTTRVLCAWLRVLGGGLHALRLVLLLLVVGNRRLDGVLGEHRAVDLHRRQRQLGDDLRVLDRERLLDRLPLQPLGGEAGAGDRRAAPER